MTQRKLQRQCSNTSRESKLIDVEIKKSKTTYSANDPGRIMLIIKYPFTQLGKKAREIFYQRIRKREGR